MFPETFSAEEFVRVLRKLEATRDKLEAAEGKLNMNSMDEKERQYQATLVELRRHNKELEEEGRQKTKLKEELEELKHKRLREKEDAKD